MRWPGRLTLADLLAWVGAAGFGLAWLHWLVPGRVGPTLVLVGPLGGILWARSRGRRGVVGGVQGGAVQAVAYLADFLTGPHGPGRPGPSSMPNWPPQLLIMGVACIGIGLGLGVVTWLIEVIIRGLGWSGRRTLPVPV